MSLPFSLSSSRRHVLRAHGARFRYTPDEGRTTIGNMMGVLQDIIYKDGVDLASMRRTLDDIYAYICIDKNTMLTCPVPVGDKSCVTRRM